MSDSHVKRVPAGFPPDVDMEEFLRHAPPEMRRRLSPANVEYTYTPEWVSTFVRELDFAGSWMSEVRKVVQQLNGTPTRFHPQAISVLTRLEHLARLAPEEGHSIRMPLERPGYLSLYVPTAAALLAGHAVGGNLSRVLSSALRLWYAGDVDALVHDLGMEKSQMLRFIEGTAGHRDFGNYGLVVRMAEGLRVPVRSLDQAWFSDKFWRVMGRHSGDFMGEDARVLRAQTLMNMAQMRLGGPMHPVRSAETSVDAVELAITAMRAGFHPKTVLPIFAALLRSQEYAYEEVSAYAEQQALKGDLLRAATACFLAALHIEGWGDPKRLMELLSQGNIYLLELPEFPIEIDRTELLALQSHFSNRVLELQQHMDDIVNRNPGSLAVLKTHPLIVEGRQQIHNEIEKRRSVPPPALTAAQPESATGPVAIAAAADADGVDFDAAIEAFSAPRRSAIDEIRGTPVWQAVARHGRLDLVEGAFRVAQPHAANDTSASAISPVIVYASLARLAEQEGIEVERPAEQDPSELEVGATITFGGIEFDSTTLTPTASGLAMLNMARAGVIR